MRLLAIMVILGSLAAGCRSSVLAEGGLEVLPGSVDMGRIDTTRVDPTLTGLVLSNAGVLPAKLVGVEFSGEGSEWLDARALSDRQLPPGHVLELELRLGNLPEGVETGWYEVLATVEFDVSDRAGGGCAPSVVPVDSRSVFEVPITFTVVSACDADGDGYISLQCGGDDCDDEDGAVYPGAEERCNGLDEDCDGRVPEEEIDQDGQGQSSCAGD